MFDPTIEQERLHSEGELYKVVHTLGECFELRYGYYSDIDRGRPPDVIYPNFIKEPLYNGEGYPFITLMQDACEQFRGTAARTEDSGCFECMHAVRGEEWFGICTCPQNRKYNDK